MLMYQLQLLGPLSQLDMAFHRLVTITRQISRNWPIYVYAPNKFRKEMHIYFLFLAF